MQSSTPGLSSCWHAIGRDGRSRFSDGRETWHKHGGMTARKPRRAAPPLNEASLRELALRYVGRFATTRAKLRFYLSRKVRERGWSGPGKPDLTALVMQFSEQGYVDDSGYALAKARALSARGYGKRRLTQQLRAAGVEEPDSVSARELSDGEALTAAMRFARRRRIGPFAASPATPEQREKAIAAMIRAGHDFALARTIASLAPDAAIDLPGMDP
jgi:regulatory protein